MGLRWDTAILEPRKCRFDQSGWGESGVTLAWTVWPTVSGAVSMIVFSFLKDLQEAFRSARLRPAASPLGVRPPPESEHRLLAVWSFGKSSAPTGQTKTLSG